MDDAPKILIIEANVATGETKLFREDAKEASIPGLKVDPTRIRSVRIIRGVNLIQIETKKEERFNIELPSKSFPSPINDRPIVYLDQNIWSRLATAIYNPEKLDKNEYESALWLIGLARDMKVILPFSSATLNETSHWADNDRRYKLGATISELSHGWQMLDPIKIRHSEICSALGDYKGTKHFTPPNVWSLSPNTVFGDRVNTQNNQVNLNLDPDISLDVESITSILSMIDLLLDTQPIERMNADAWAKHWNDLADEIGSNNKAQQNIDLVAHAAFLSDARLEIAEAAEKVNISEADLAKWAFEESRRVIDHMPAFGLAKEVFRLKLSNTGARWRSNDLTDIFYMVQACGYATAVIGERSFSNLVGSAQRRLHRNTNSFYKISALRESKIIGDL